MKLKNLVGQRFGRLTVIKRAPNTSRARWLCQCDCGNKKIVFGNCLIKKCTQSCGCLRSEITSKRSIKHGFRSNQNKKHKINSEYNTWKHIKDRCTNPKNKYYKNYGGRGITVSISWRKSFENFYHDMGPKPKSSFTLERINNNKGYSKENCKWASRKEQCRNKRNNHHLTIKGVTKCLMEWSEIFHIKYDKLRYLIKYHSDNHAIKKIGELYVRRYQRPIHRFSR
jgi:hypothetical protein